MSVKVLYTAHAVSTGGRNGHSASSDGVVSVDLSIPKSMGGPGKPGTTTPEDLFAVGYAACFGSAVEFFGNQLKLKPTSVEIDHAVSVGLVDGEMANGFGLVVDIEVKIAGLSQEDADKLVEVAHSGCPYSRAIKGNVPVTLKVTVV